MSSLEFEAAIEDAASKFAEINKNEIVRVISHLDSDGISAASIIIKALHYENRKYELSIVPQLDNELLKRIAKERYNLFLFTDLGSANIHDIEGLFMDKKIFILDHHKPRKEVNRENIIHVNPHLFGIEEDNEISGSGVSYLFSKHLDERIKNMSYIALVGAIGDVQEKKGFFGLNNEILKDALDSGKVKIEKGIRFLGYKKRALHKLLEYSNNIDIPGVTGDEKGAIAFLKELGIYGMENNWKTLIQLNEEEILRLADGIVLKTGNKYTKEEILCNNYIFPDEEEQLRDAREFSTLLNACGRMNKAIVGVGACLGDKKMKEKAIACLDDYRREITKAIEWVNENRKTGNIIEKGKFMIINAKDKVLGTIIGTIASMISNSIKEGTYIMSMAHLINGNTKISLRVSGRREDVDLREIIKEIIDKLHIGEFGGHKYAAGALIPTEKEDEFLQIAQEILEKRSLEEEVC